MISTGCKTLCCIYHCPELIFFGTTMGDNCYPYVIELAKKRDITLVLEHYAEIPDYASEEHVIYYNGNLVSCEFDYADEFSEWHSTTGTEEYLQRIVNNGPYNG